MFSKPTKPSQAALPALSETKKPPLKVAALVPAEISVNGLIRGDGDLHVDGVVHGDVKVRGLCIGETGHVEGAITADSVEVRGRVVGTISAKNVRLFGTAYVDGDIRHDQLTVDTGAFFQGRCLRREREVPTKPVVQGSVIELQTSQAKSG
jgi:cytoskeletal protein CcmA (bactofilin family)